MKQDVLAVLLLFAACAGPVGRSSSEDLEREMARALAERGAARAELAELASLRGSFLDVWRLWRAEARLERAILDLDALQRRQLEGRARAAREAEARSTSAWETIDHMLDSASAALRSGDLAASERFYARASDLLDARSSEPLSEPPPTLPLLLAETRGVRSLLAQRVEIARRLARIDERSLETASALARLEEDRIRLAGLSRLRGVLERGDPNALQRGRSLPSDREPVVDRVVEARRQALMGEELRLREEGESLREAIERIDAAIATRPGSASDPRGTAP